MLQHHTMEAFIELVKERTQYDLKLYGKLLAELEKTRDTQCICNRLAICNRCLRLHSLSASLITLEYKYEKGN